MLAFLQLRDYEIKHNIIPGKSGKKKKMCRDNDQDTATVEDHQLPKGVSLVLGGFLGSWGLGEVVCSRDVAGVVRVLEGGPQARLSLLGCTGPQDWTGVLTRKFCL